MSSEGAIAKFWLNSVRLASSPRFSARELRRLEPVVLENHTRFLEAWRQFFGPEH